MAARYHWLDITCVVGYSHNQGLRNFWLSEYFYGKGLESPNFLTLAMEKMAQIHQILGKTNFSNRQTYTMRSRR
jgi:hypothetical protein